MTYYYPKRPVKSFQDLEVYQKTLGISVEIVKRITADRSAAEVDANPLESKSQEGQNVKDKRNFGIGTADIRKEMRHLITRKLINCVLRIPKLIAIAHSVRFGEPKKAVNFLEKAMVNCNLAVYYLELVRDLGETKIETDYFEEQIKEYLRVRGKIMRLQRAWLKFMGGRNEKI